MNYILLNRDNVVVDILVELRYIKLQSSNGYVVACEESEGTGVIGSDCNTHYTLIKADTTSNRDAVRVMIVDEVPSEAVVGKSRYDEETGEFVPRYTLAEV